MEDAEEPGQLAKLFFKPGDKATANASLAIPPGDEATANAHYCF